MTCDVFEREIITLRAVFLLILLLLMSSHIIPSFKGREFTISGLNLLVGIRKYLEHCLDYLRESMEHSTC